MSNRLHDEHMLDHLIDALAQHERVFATVGVTHAVMLEPALLAAVDKRTHHSTHAADVPPRVPRKSPASS